MTIPDADYYAVMGSFFWVFVCAICIIGFVAAVSSVLRSMDDELDSE